MHASFDLSSPVAGPTRAALDARLVHQFLERNAQERPERSFLVTESEHLSYGEVEARANRAARALRALGVGRGDRVALLDANSRFYVESYYGILKAGAIAVPLNHALDAEALAGLVRRCEARVLLAGERFERLAAELSRRAPQVRRIPSDELDSARESESPEPLDLQVAPDDVASIVYTSGSTGAPLGATLSHLALTTNARSIVSALGLGADDRVLVVLPFYYVYGKSLLNTHAAVGGSLAIENRFLYPNVALDTLEREACTGLAGVPSTFSILLNRSSFAQRAMPSLRYATQAGGAMSPALVRRLAAALPGRKIFLMYGATEAAARLTCLPPERLAEKPDSIGIPIPGVELRILDPDGAELPPRQLGEIVARGANLMSGYWGDPEATARVLDRDGYHTGDLGWRDEEGCFYVAGRITEQIKSGAHRISPKEIEDALIEVPEVHEAAVIGVPDELLGERIKAFVVLREGAAPSAETLLRTLRRRLPAYKLPSEIAFLPELPKAGSGKVLKRALR